MNDSSWTETAKTFYDEEARENLDPKRYQTFSEAYGKITGVIDFQKNWRVLDAGCGTGVMTHALSDKVKSIIGIDLSTESLAIARKFNPKQEFLEADMTRLPFPDEEFDACIAMTSIEFCPQRERAFSEIHRVLKPGGKFFLEVRNADFIIFHLPKPVLSLLYKTGILVPYPADQFKDLTFEEWKTLATSAGFKITKEIPSLRPWQYGSFMTQTKNAFIDIIRKNYPLKSHYMISLVLEK